MRASTKHLPFAIAAVSCNLPCPGPVWADPAQDPTFGTGGVTWTAFGSGNSDEPRDLLVQPDGSILTAGVSHASDGDYVAITRHSADGVLDTAGFGVGGKVYVRWEFRDKANAIGLQADGKILAAGMQMTSTGVSSQTPSVYRFHTDGTVDSAFGNAGCAALWSGTATGENAAVKVLPDGSVLVGGRRHPGYNGGSTGFAMRRYHPDGSLMMASTREFAIDRGPGSCAFPDGGGILLAYPALLNGRFEFVMARVDSAGDPDAGFGTGGVVQTGIEMTFNTALRVRVLSDGRILLAGTTPRDGGGTQWTALRFHPDGTLDTGFGILGRTDVQFGDGVDEHCYDAEVDADGRILLAGRASYVGGQPGLARLLPGGGPDPAFSDDGRFAIDLNGVAGPHYLTRVLALPDGKILAAGFDIASGSGDFFLVRLVPSDPTGIQAAGPLPSRLSIRATPNPSKGETALRLQLPREQVVTVEIFDAAGRAVRRLFDGTLSSGAHGILWDGRDRAGREIPAGVYFIRMSTSGETRTAKLVRVR